ncbi:methyltransferase domain-containing protein [Streptomyces sp. NBC_00696]|uniref:methyltransferase domain-containing protein n=1 Tax=Streptomyces sp. NBC_00696 TaxID=2903672 RepID=UPI002E34CBBC|nr:methyltransferase domain-containing protein [Streptomyces sp. NBC_00696]
MDWEEHAAALAAEVTDPVSRWREPVAAVPRHELVPRWWERTGKQWVLRDGPSNPGAWLKAAYCDASLVTSVGGQHADHARGDEQPAGLPTSSATMPSLVVRFLRHARLAEGLDLLDLGTGAGGLAAYAARRLGSRHVTSLDVDPYLVDAAACRLARMGLHPQFFAMDALHALPGTYDRIIATVALEPGAGLKPALGALRTGGRLVTTLANTSLILTAWKTEDGGARGQIERDWAGFMKTRHGADYQPGLDELLTHARGAKGEEVTVGRYPVLDVGVWCTIG